LKKSGSFCAQTPDHYNRRAGGEIVSRANRERSAPVRTSQRLAAGTPNQDIREQYEALARRWRDLAESIGRDDQQGPARSFPIDQLNASNDD
jgi:hypothetical protein